MFAYIKADVEGFKERQWMAWCDQVSQNSESQLKKQLLVWVSLCLDLHPDKILVI